MNLFLLIKFYIFTYSFFNLQALLMKKKLNQLSYLTYLLDGEKLFG